LLILEFESKLLGIESDSTRHVAALITDAVNHVQDGAAVCSLSDVPIEAAAATSRAMAECP
jgi:hypothetical protein